MLINEFNADVQIPTLLARQSPLHLAVAGGFRQIASMLLTFGSDLHARNSKGCTPLHLVNNFSVLKLLFKYDVDPCAKNNAGETPSQYYIGNIGPEKSKDIIDFLTAKEISRELELTRLKMVTLKVQLKGQEEKRIKNKV